MKLKKKTKLKNKKIELLHGEIEKKINIKRPKK